MYYGKDEMLASYEIYMYISKHNDNLHHTLNFNSGKEKGISNNISSEHSDISIIIKFGCKML